MPTITFEWRHCAGLRDPGKLIAKDLGFDYVDRIMLAHIAKKVGSTVEAVAMRKLKKPTLVDKFAKGVNQILNNSNTVGVGGDPYFGPGIENIMAKDFHELDETIIRNPEDVDYIKIHLLINTQLKQIKSLKQFGENKLSYYFQLMDPLIYFLQLDKGNYYNFQKLIYQK